MFSVNLTGYLPELFIILAIAVIVLIARRNPGENIYKYVTNKAADVYDKYAPYSFKSNKLVREFLSKERDNMKLIEEHQRLEQNTTTNK